MSYLCYVCLFGSSLPSVVCRSADVLFMLFVFSLRIVVSNTYCVLCTLCCQLL